MKEVTKMEEWNVINDKLDDKMLTRFVEEYELFNEEKIIKVNNAEYLISGYNRIITESVQINMLVINNLVYMFYNDAFALVSNLKSIPVIYENGQKAVIETNGEEIFDPCFVYLNDAIHTNGCNKLVIKLRWYAMRGMEGIIFGYFFGDFKPLVNLRRLRWNKCFTTPTKYYEPLIAKGFLGDEAVRYTNNGTKKIGVPLNIITPVILSQSIWTLVYDFKCKNIQIRYKGVKLTTLSMISTKYILPLFGLLSEKGGDYIKIIDIYTM